MKNINKANGLIGKFAMVDVSPEMLKLRSLVSGGLHDISSALLKASWEVTRDGAMGGAEDISDKTLAELESNLADANHCIQKANAAVKHAIWHLDMGKGWVDQERKDLEK